MKRLLGEILRFGDKILCEVKEKIQVLTVVKVHDYSEIDVNDSTIEYKWCFSKVDIEQLNTLKEEENKFLMCLRDKQRERMKSQIVEMLNIDSLSGVELNKEDDIK